MQSASIAALLHLSMYTLHVTFVKTCQFIFCLFSFFAVSWGESEPLLLWSVGSRIAAHPCLSPSLAAAAPVEFRCADTGAARISPQVENSNSYQYGPSESVPEPISLIDDFVSTHSPQGGYRLSGSLWYFNIEASIDGSASSEDVIDTGKWDGQIDVCLRAWCRRDKWMSHFIGLRDVRSP